MQKLSRCHQTEAELQAAIQDIERTSNEDLSSEKKSLETDSSNPEYREIYETVIDKAVEAGSNDRMIGQENLTNIISSPDEIPQKIRVEPENPNSESNQEDLLILKDRAQKEIENTIERSPETEKIIDGREIEKSIEKEAVKTVERVIETGKKISENTDRTTEKTIEKSMTEFMNSGAKIGGPFRLSLRSALERDIERQVERTFLKTAESETGQPENGTKSRKSKKKKKKDDKSQLRDMGPESVQNKISEYMGRGNSSYVLYEVKLGEDGTLIQNEIPQNSAKDLAAQKLVNSPKDLPGEVSKTPAKGSNDSISKEESLSEKLISYAGMLNDEVHEKNQDTASAPGLLHEGTIAEIISKNVREDIAGRDEESYRKGDEISSEIRNVIAPEIGLIHKRAAEIDSEEILENIRRQNETKRRIEVETARETVKNVIQNEIKTANSVNHLHKNTKSEIQELVSDQVRDQVSVITDKIYKKLEHRLQDERRRRGY